MKKNVMNSVFTYVLNIEERKEAFLIVRRVKLFLKDGTEKEVDKGLTCEGNDSDKIIYMMLTEHTKNDNGLWNVYVIGYIPETDEIIFDDEFDDRSWQIINDVIDKKCSKGLFKKKPLVKVNTGKIKDLTILY